MTNALTELGRQGFLDGSIDWDTNTFSAALLDLGTAETANLAITSSSLATPTVITTTASHGLTTGDIVWISGHATNLAANGFWKITVTGASTFSLQTLAGANVVGVAGTGGTALVYGGASTVGQFWSDFDGCLVGAKQTLGSPTVVDGVADMADVTFPLVSGATVEAIAIFKDTGTPGTSRMVALITGYQQVICAATTTGTSIPVDKLLATVVNGTYKWSTGESTVVSAGAAGARALTVTSTTVTVEATVSVPASGSGLPVNPNGGNIVVAWDNGVNKIFKL